MTALVDWQVGEKTAEAGIGAHPLESPVGHGDAGGDVVAVCSESVVAVAEAGHADERAAVAVSEAAVDEAGELPDSRIGGGGWAGH